MHPASFFKHMRSSLRQAALTARGILEYLAEERRHPDQGEFRREPIQLGTVDKRDLYRHLTKTSLQIWFLGVFCNLAGGKKGLKIHTRTKIPK